MKNNFTKTNIFACPIYKIRIDPNSYDKEKILKDIKYNKSLKNKRNDTQYNFKNCDIHHSYMDFDNKNFKPINYDKLMDVYTKTFSKFFDKQLYTAKEFVWTFTIVNYLAVTEGQHLPSHNHVPTDDFATVHYLNFKDEHAPTLFYNPAIFASTLKYMRPDLADTLDSSARDNQYMWEHFAWKVKEDDMVIFPSAINHEIMTQGPTKEPRITISTNLKIIPDVEMKEVA